MAKKDAVTKKKHRKVLDQHKMNRLFWVVTRDYDTVLICKNRITGEFRCICK